MTQPALINFGPNEYRQEFHYYPFAAKLNRYFGSCSTVNDLSNKVCVPNQTEDFNLSLFSRITEINQSKVLSRDIRSRFDGRNCNSDQWWYTD